MRHKKLNGHTGEWDDLDDSLKKPKDTSAHMKMLRIEYHDVEQWGSFLLLW